MKLNLISLKNRIYSPVIFIIDLENQKAFLSTALLLNCNVKTFWNMRRELVLRNELDVSIELRYINLVLSYWRKGETPMNYRKWLLEEKLVG